MNHLLDMDIYKYYEVDLNKLTYIKNNDDNIQIYYNDNKHLKPLVISLPFLYCYDNMNIKGSHITIYEIILSLITKNKNHQYKLISFFKNLDETIKNDIDNSWLSGDKHYKYLIHHDDNYIYKHGCIKLKCIDSNNFNTQFYYNTSKIHSNIVEVFKEPCYVKAVVEIVSLHIHNNIISLNLRPHIIQIIKTNVLDFNNHGDSDLDELDELSDKLDDL
jgi:hypothetical protein